MLYVYTYETRLMCNRVIHKIKGLFFELQCIWPVMSMSGSKRECKAKPRVHCITFCKMLMFKLLFAFMSCL